MRQHSRSPASPLWISSKRSPRYVAIQNRSWSTTCPSSLVDGSIPGPTKRVRASIHRARQTVTERVRAVAEFIYHYQGELNHQGLGNAFVFLDTTGFTPESLKSPRTASVNSGSRGELPTEGWPCSCSVSAHVFRERRLVVQAYAVGSSKSNIV